MNNITSKLNKTPYTEITCMYRDMIANYRKIIGEKSEFGVTITMDFLSILIKRLGQLYHKKDEINSVFSDK